MLVVSSFCATQMFAQEETSGNANVYRGAGYDVLDTSLIPERRFLI